jgi:uncharacterized membrane protein
MNFKNSKNLGIIGAFIIFFEVILLRGIPAFNILKFTGIIVILISLYNLANFYQSKNIFNNARIGALMAIIGIIISLASGGIIPTIPSFVMWSYARICYSAIVGVFFTVSAFYVRRSLNELASRSGTALFKTASLVLFIGAILTIIMLIGLPIMWIAFLILAIAFFTMKEPNSPHTNNKSFNTANTANQTEAEANTALILCPNCSINVPPDTIFCTQCGTQLKTKN